MCVNAESVDFTRCVCVCLCVCVCGCELYNLLYQSSSLFHRE